MPFTLTGAQVRARRLLYHVTQAELARQLGYTRQAISKWECRRADHPIPTDQARRIEDAYPSPEGRCSHCGAPKPRLLLRPASFGTSTSAPVFIFG